MVQTRSDWQRFDVPTSDPKTRMLGEIRMYQSQTGGFRAEYRRLRLTNHGPVTVTLKLNDMPDRIPGLKVTP